MFDVRFGGEGEKGMDGGGWEMKTRTAMRILFLLYVSPLSHHQRRVFFFDRRPLQPIP